MATRLRLAERANDLEFVEAVDQIVESLPLELGFETALTLMDGLPPVVEAHPSMVAVRRQVASVLVQGIKKRLGEEEGDDDEREDEEEEDEAAAAAAEVEAQLGVDALAKCLGPVAGMFATTKYLSDAHNRALPLRKDVQQLPLCVFKRVLKSEALQLQSENETYPFLLAWHKHSVAMQQIVDMYYDEEEVQLVFDELAHCCATTT